MIIALDNTFLSLVFKPGAQATSDPATGSPVSHCEQRIEALIDSHSKRGDRVLLPTPCLAELLCAVPDVAKIMNEIDGSAAFQIAPFDAKAAVELAEETRKAILRGDKKSGVDANWQKIKFDRQIAAIAKANRAEIFFTDDKIQSKFAEEMGLLVKHTWDLDLPVAYAQQDLLDNDG